MKLTLNQHAVLAEAKDRGRICVADAESVGGSFRTIGSPERAGLLSEWRMANGLYWELTEAGRAALQEVEP